jgi:hypothetical protein
MMMPDRIRYIGSDDPGEHVSTTAFGHTFEKGRWHSLTPETEGLRTNPMFEVKEESDPLDHDGDGERGGSLSGEHSTAAIGARRRRRKTKG